MIWRTSPRVAAGLTLPCPGLICWAPLGQDWCGPRLPQRVKRLVGRGAALTESCDELPRSVVEVGF